MTDGTADTDRRMNPSSDSRNGDDALTGADYIRWGWHALSRDPFLAVFEAATSVLSYMLTPLLLLTVFALVSARVVRLLEAGARPFALLERVATHPFWWLGLLGLGASIWILQFCLSAAVTGGTRGTVARSIAGEPIRPVSSFLNVLPAWFPVMIALRLVRGLAVGIAGLVAATVAIALGYSMLDASGGAGSWPLVIQAVWLAAPMTLAFGFILLARVGVDCAVGPIFCGGASIFGGIAEGARFFIDRFGLIYRILAAGAVVLLVPLVGVWLVTLLALLIPTTGPAAAIGLAIRLAAQGALIMALPVAGLLISSGLMAAWYHLEGDGAPPQSVVSEAK